MKKITLSILLLAFSNFLLIAQNKEVIDKMIEEVNYLASDKLEGRETGTESEKLAARYIRDKFKEYNVLPKGTDGYFQYFEATIKSQPHSEVVEKKINGINVIGYLDNTQKETVVIGAHYDHLGYGHYGSLHDGDKEIHNGADDNASGVSVLINLVNELSENKNYNYLFIAFSGEEHGLLGSSYYAKNPTIDLSTVRFMINFDMVGRLNDENVLALNGVGTSSCWDSLTDKANRYNFKLKKSDSGVGPSDHTSFYLQNIPVLHLFTGQHEDYHKPTDDVDKINFNGMYLIMSYVSNIIEKSVIIDDFDFKETVNDTGSTPKFKVTLGVMPDYLYDGIGLRIDGVSKNKTADKFGILKGDIVLKLGTIEVTDIFKYMQGLSKFEVGDSTTVRVKRQEEILDISIIFQ